MNPRDVVFVVDDERVIADTLGTILRDAGYAVEVFYDGTSALAGALRRPPSLVVSDVVMPLMDGFTLADRVKLLCPECKILFVSGSAAILETARTTFEIIFKPVPPPALLARIQCLLD